jgi:glycosyltransferase involved in cell wall biosynthesis
VLDATVVIPTFNRCDVLQRTLARLGLVDHPPERWEVVIVDDGSTDDTQSVVARWIENQRFAARILRQTNAGPASARNRGAAAAQGRFLLFLDNDISVPADFVRRHCEALASQPKSLVGGRVVHSERLRETPFGRYRDSVWEQFHRSHPPDRISETTGVTGQNLSIAAADFRSLGGFDEQFTIASSEDWDLGQRARQAGMRVLYDPTIVVEHDDWAVSLSRFCERQRLYAISDVRLWQKYGDASPRLRVIEENRPIERADGPRVVAKKAAKLVLSTAPGGWLLSAACDLCETVAPDSGVSRRFYEAAVGVAIFQGVREGLRRHGGDPLETPPPVTVGSLVE